MTLSRELIDGANGRIADDLADVYQQVAGLLRWSGHADAATKYDLLADKCRFQGRRSRNRPPQFFREQSSGADFGENLAPIVPR